MLKKSVNAFGPTIRSSLQGWSDKISWVKRYRYTAIEISIGYLELIFKGGLNPLRLQIAKKLFLNCGLVISVHQPAVLDLRSRANGDMHIAVAKACLDFAEHIDSGVFVVHYTKESPSIKDEEIFIDRIRRLADYAEPKGITIAIENIETGPAEAVAEIVDRLSLKNVGMAYDLPHDWLAARRFDYDFLESAHKVAPYVKHIHLHDNFGIYAELRLKDFMLYKTVPFSEWLPMGEGDLHLPIGWGNIPFDQAIDRISPYTGMVITEYHLDKFSLEHRDIAQTLAQKANMLWVRGKKRKNKEKPLK